MRVVVKFLDGTTREFANAHTATGGNGMWLQVYELNDEGARVRNVSYPAYRIFSVEEE